uniref:Translation initiation factor eIF2B subunit alpha n=1 Tax=Albugo laibachii Nc14 TaxID=890382 RepID=F0WDI2_9STRA|nr:translation initiation factor eIF2B subunit alpha pu [Albugo laibachii Nc14]|eukprot:CCA19255.1 translation initiation factor eIF2B subunit alpha pu [Albugo laibachii Nc14]
MSVLQDFRSYLLDSEVAVAVGVIKALTNVIIQSEATTMMQMESELRDAAQELTAFPSRAKEESNSNVLQYQNSIGITASCQLFLRYVTRCFLEFTDFESCKTQLIDRGKLFAETSLASRKKIAEIGHRFIRDGMVVLTHGISRVTIAVLSEASKKTHFSVLVTEGKSHNAGAETARKLAAFGIPITIIQDAAVGYHMEKVDMVIVGADGVVENGGIINSIGSFGIAVIAQALKKPFYVASESYKFARLYPLNQRDVPQTFIKREAKEMDEYGSTSTIHIENQLHDYTPPQFITLLFTDLGALTPSAVSDELIKLYQ